MTLDVLHVDTAREWRGGQRQLLLLARGLVARGWRTAVACPEAGRLWAELGAAGVPRIPIPAGRSPRTAARLLAAGPRLLAAHTSHAHTLCALLPRPLVVHRRVDFVPSGGWKYRQPAAYICVSRAVGRIVEEAGGTGVHVVHDGVEALPPAPPAPDGPAVLAVGALVAHKAHDVLAAAAALLPGVDVGVAGEGPLRFEGLRHLGQREDVAALHAAARVFVQPSREEGMGQAVVEAMLSGLPVVVSDAGGLPEVVGEAGIVVPREDAAALAAAIRRALAGAHPSLEGARQRARERFSVDAMVEGSCAVYTALLD